VRRLSGTVEELRAIVDPPPRWPKWLAGALLFAALCVGAWWANKTRDPSGLLLVTPTTGYAGELHAVDLEHARGFVVGKAIRR
jgi:hypothetical protein